MARSLLLRLLSFVVPPLCATCREPDFSDAPLCSECRARLVPVPDPRCERCGAPAAFATAVCRECRGRALVFSRAWSAFAYEGVAREAVSALKSRGAFALAALMAEEIAARAPAGLLGGSIVPVPAHGGRSRRYGFNQAEALARALGRASSLPVRDLLSRAGSAVPQVGLERRARLANASGSVRLRKGLSAPALAVLVDDVYTTGATLDACGRALRKAGAREVVAVTFARAVRGGE